MKFHIHKLSVVQLQWLVWGCVLLIVFFAIVGENQLRHAVVFTLLNTGFYAAVIYGNISFLYPRFYEKGKHGAYFCYSAIFVISIAITRGFVAMYIYNHHFAKNPQPLTPGLLLTFVASATLYFIVGLILRTALAYFKLKQQSEEILLQTSKAELQFLKSQVQPHFLFNTLNNIYYEVYTEAPKSAVLIERLSEIMRYFVD
jgi:sensor histidine kinase YesM